MAFLLHQAHFYTTVHHLCDLPPTVVPEIAFAGRSNAGKSTAINILCNQKRLAFASKRPGRTQYINYFSVGPVAEPVANLVDVPGYGYAEVPGAGKACWETLLPAYLKTRPQLRGIILMMDSRRPLTALDCRMIEWFAPTGKPIHTLLTKCDKLIHQENVNTLRNTKKALEAYRDAGYEGALTCQLFSALKRIGIEEAHVLVESWLQPEGDGEDDAAVAE
ncbi:MAG: ribosome biogenesis GTP-binding protein YihA/YsxC [Burkholderia sp.]